MTSKINIYFYLNRNSLFYLVRILIYFAMKNDRNLLKKIDIDPDLSQSIWIRCSRMDVENTVPFLHNNRI